MESEIKEIGYEAVAREKVNGYMAIDGNGLCLVREGVASESMAGVLGTISFLAKQLGPEDKQTSNPVIQIKSRQRKILIQTKEDITTVLYKSN
jgi:hypothetical protein